ncbi:energy transducer TonB [Pseudomonas viridiflava]|uniref:energy transducer TonB n=1 Tax=Pseudomonas viridiflava TaxID=33069 RepID=UPI0020BEDA28|nr:energy transducer TonB [Pseudomonas viridiflava]
MRPKLHAAWLLLSLASVAHGLPSYPVPRHMPDIEYPRSLRLSAVSGVDVSVRVFIKASGEVRFLEVLNTTDPAIIAAAKHVVEQWRFEAWEPPASHPEGENVTVTYQFAEAAPSRPPLDENADLRKVMCSQINRESRQKDSLGTHAPYELDVFLRTERYLSSGPVVQLFLSLDERDALVRDLLQAVPTVIASCRDNPGRRYVDYLPERVRQSF